MATTKGGNSDAVRAYKETAVEAINSIQTALEAGEYKKALFHVKAANIAIDDMMASSGITEGSYD